MSERIRHDARLSTRIEERIRRMSTCLEHNERLVTQLLSNFNYTLALPHHASNNLASFERSTNDDKNEMQKDPEIRSSPSSTLFRMFDSTLRNQRGSNLPESETHSYDSTIQILAHLTRDWTKEGRSVRQSVYDWCCEQVEKYSPQQQGAKILVPGAGMGRLAYDLYQKRHHVEANELSLSMAAAASVVLQGSVTGYLHPYLLDVMANEVDSDRRYDASMFPDVDIQGNILPDASLSYTVDDFVGGQQDFYYVQRLGSFDVIVTCFFIDTAHNIYEYLGMIEALLKPKTGIWVNVGPVQWHPKAVLRPSVDELKDLVQVMGWKVKVWKVDDEPVSYRESDPNFVRMTNYNGYRPLRFVVARSN
ncbi:MAG: hypothetical protein SGILL_006024 [Bacillariaceae sp.]